MTGGGFKGFHILLIVNANAGYSVLTKTESSSQGESSINELDKSLHYLKSVHAEYYSGCNICNGNNCKCTIMLLKDVNHVIC